MAAGNNFFTIVPQIKWAQSFSETCISYLLPPLRVEILHSHRDLPFNIKTMSCKMWRGGEGGSAQIQVIGGYRRFLVYRPRCTNEQYVVQVLVRSIFHELSCGIRVTIQHMNGKTNTAHSCCYGRPIPRSSAIECFTLYAAMRAKYIHVTTLTASEERRDSR